jgi:hypothetical protein
LYSRAIWRETPWTRRHPIAIPRVVTRHAFGETARGVVPTEAGNPRGMWRPTALRARAGITSRPRIPSARHLGPRLRREFLDVALLRLRIRSVVATQSAAHLGAMSGSYSCANPNRHVSRVLGSAQGRWSATACSRAPVENLREATGLGDTRRVFDWSKATVVLVGDGCSRSGERGVPPGEDATEHALTTVDALPGQSFPRQPVNVVADSPAPGIPTRCIEGSLGSQGR